MLAVAAAAGLFIGLSLGALGGGGSILAVPVLVYLLGQTPVAATTGSLVIVGISSLAGAVAAWRQGNVLVGRGLAFGALGTVGATGGAILSVRVDEKLLLALFAVLMLVVAAVMLTKQLRHRSTRSVEEGSPRVDDPIITVSPTFACNCPIALKVLLTALVVGLMTGFFGVGGGFLVVPALVLALRLPMPLAVGTSLAVITINSAAGFATRVSQGTDLDWVSLGVLTAAAVLGGVLGTRVTSRVDPRRLGIAFGVLLLGVASYTAWQSIPALLS
jgi:uncharacterized membrane protein YfcA